MLTTKPYTETFFRDKMLEFEFQSPRSQSHCVLIILALYHAFLHCPGTFVCLLACLTLLPHGVPIGNAAFKARASFMSYFAYSVPCNMTKCNNFAVTSSCRGVPWALPGTRNDFVFQL